MNECHMSLLIRHTVYMGLASERKYKVDDVDFRDVISFSKVEPMCMFMLNVFKVHIKLTCRKRVTNC